MKTSLKNLISRIHRAYSIRKLILRTLNLHKIELKGKRFLKLDSVLESLREDISSGYELYVIAYLCNKKAFDNYCNEKKIEAEFNHYRLEAQRLCGLHLKSIYQNRRDVFDGGDSINDDSGGD